MSARVDAWLWSIRLYKTRTQATNACTGGHVKVNGATVKAAHKLAVGDRVEAYAGDRRRVVEVVELISKRVGAPRAAECFVDHSPPAPPPDRAGPVAVRDRGAGRPTKRDRRQIEQFRGRD